jgi:hypothetical protein
MMWKTRTGAEAFLVARSRRVSDFSWRDLFD